MEVSLGLAFIAGVISFVSPCVLALVPAYLAYLGGTAAQLEAVAVGGTRHSFGQGARVSLMYQALLFTMSFTAIFVLLGISVGLLGAPLFRIVPSAREVAGLAVIAVGIAMTGAFGPILSRVNLRTRGTGRLPAGQSARSITLGGLFALGWSPCIGPVLGAILTMGASSQDVGVAGLLLAFYGLGLAVPFLIAAAAMPRIRPVMSAVHRWQRQLEVIGGLFVATMGVLIYLNAFARMASLFAWRI